MDDEALLQKVCKCISLKQEQDFYDFKRQWYLPDQKWELLHDILCMSNTQSNEDCLIILGVDEKQDYSICGVDNDPNRKTTQNLVDFLRTKKFAGGARPLVYVKNFIIQGKTVDVIVIPNTNQLPYYLFNDFDKVKAYYIYTREMDSNTPINRQADYSVIEALWKRRFGIDKTAIEKAHIYLSDVKNWKTIDGSETYYYMYAPEFTISIESASERNGYEYYLFSQDDSTPNWYYFRLSYHQTVIYNTMAIAFDGARYFNVAPEFEMFSSVIEKRNIHFYAYTKGTTEYALFAFYSEKVQDEDSLARFAEKKLLKCIPIFESLQEKEDFLEFAEKRFQHKEIDKIRLPYFEDSLRNGENIDFYKDGFYNALLVIDLLEEFRHL